MRVVVDAVSHPGKEAARLVAALIDLVDQSLGNRDKLFRLCERSQVLMEVLIELQERMVSDGSWKRIVGRFKDVLNVGTWAKCSICGSLSWARQLS